jgi:uncharacterized membrane protein (DUF4010 family)
MNVIAHFARLVFSPASISARAAPDREPMPLSFAHTSSALAVAFDNCTGTNVVSASTLRGRPTFFLDFDILILTVSVAFNILKLSDEGKEVRRRMDQS